ncbi:Sister chromatid cohesion protein DCC1 [Boothiomyces macroporosus]|uniref:Sister chromatid cohesion protein DCC1 n=1 Tax=Boothiomyces macroporosus TaxID=261099 RepID=A0AAD5UJQ0_9FUNG|nr:Sister chromatid cohesion protein DCC1 [Boothiomyces macroporosus]
MQDCEIYFENNALPPQDEQQNTDKKIMLLQVPMDIAKRIEAGEEFHFRGNPDDEAVLCTETKTFKIRYAETSNLMLVLDQSKEKINGSPSDEQNKENCDLSNAYQSIFGKKPLHLESTVIDSGNVFLDLVEIKPNFDPLFKRLIPYKGQDKEYEQEMVTTTDILQFCQASEIEVMEYLKSIEAMEINGFWRVLDIEYQSEVLELILLTILEHDLSMDSVPRALIVESLLEHEHLESVISHVLRIHSKSETNGMFVLDEQKICRTFGHVVLKRGESVMLLKSFLLNWKNAVPEVFDINLDYLNVLFINAGIIFIGKARYRANYSVLSKEYSSK